ncbi:MAG TPA: ABC transporter permease [Vicinamibacteria bacterium]|nr:ABC transporter permease [Vicinamibacteria bacterium]
MREWTLAVRGSLAPLKLDPCREAEIIEELAQDLEQRFADALARGATESQAEAEALAELQSSGRLAREIERSARATRSGQARGRAALDDALVPGREGGHVFKDAWQDLRYAARLLRKSPGFTLAALLSLGLGIGANTTIFTVMKALFLKPLPVEDVDSLVAMFTTDERNKGQGFDLMPISRPNYQDLRDRTNVFSAVAGFSFTPLSVSSGKGPPEQLQGFVVSGNYFDVLGVKAAHGRTFAPEEDGVPGAHPVAVISHRLWQNRFGGELSLVGGTIKLNNLDFNVIGIAPEGFRGVSTLFGADIWVPQAMYQQVVSGFVRENWDDRRAVIFFSFARLKPGHGVHEARAALNTVGVQLAKAFPSENDQRNFTATPLAEAALNPNQQDAFVAAGTAMMGVVTLVLLIACGNVANLLLARAAGRERELAVRVSLGASRWRLARQLLIESTLLALLAGCFGVLLAHWGRQALWAMRPAFMEQAVLDLSLDLRVLVFTLGVSLLTGMIFGLAPALQASRPSLTLALKDRTSIRSDANRWFSLRNALVLGQVALSLVALVGAGLFLRSLQQALRIDPGFEPRRMLLLSFDVAGEGMDAARGQEFYRQVVERVRELPMVSGASIAATPLMGGFFARTVFPEGVDNKDARSGKLTNLNQVDPGFFEATGIPMLRGRSFTESDREGAPMVAIVNQTMGERVWPGQEAVGKRFRVFGETWIIEVVGLARDAKYGTLGEPPAAHFYLPMRQHFAPSATLHVRTGGDPEPVLGAVRQQVQALAPSMPLVGVQTIGGLLDQVLWAPRMAAGLLGVFGALALLLAALGIHGVVSYSVTQRTPEVGIRMALGARAGDVLRLVMVQALAVIGSGAVVGAFGAYFATRGLASLLFGVGTADPLAFGATVAILLLTGALASYLPARRATRVDPLATLRYE